MVHLIISVIIFNLVAWLIPKRITRDEMLATSLFALQLEAEADIYLDLKYRLYGYFNPGPDWLALVPIYGIFPAITIVFLNYYPFTGKKSEKAIYIAAWSLFSALYEWSAVYAGWFFYSGWKTWYSALCYLLIFFLLIKFHDLVRWLKRGK
ncbi:CBO0543 family protein [Anaeroselena agilis]|uniref:CBO0543 family protein n=1 Tax=Anaeroselena agilis TaxID=3063788 RepID=A0ABU3P2Y8_9FIRM|nr:CBO0543 family protein [Selenomonadales bacterium 4137-cl]